VSLWLVLILPYGYLIVLVYKDSKSQVAGLHMYTDLSAGAAWSRTWSRLVSQMYHLRADQYTQTSSIQCLR
jgi:hypothetical protein